MKSQNHLNVLKIAWNNINANTYIEDLELRRIIQLNSNSIVKRIFIISLIEFALSILPFFLDGKEFFTKEILDVQNTKIMVYLDYSYYAIFIFL